MTVFYVILLVLSFALTAAEIVLESVLKIKNLGLEKRFFNFHGNTIPIEDFFPHSVFDCLIFAFSFSLLGLVLTFMDMPWMLTLLCGIIFGFLVMFSKIHLLGNILILIKGNRLPKNRPDTDEKAVCSKRIDGDGYGEIAYEYRGREYRFNAVSANETDIEEGERVIIVDKEEGFCFVEREDEEILGDDE